MSDTLAINLGGTSVKWGLLSGGAAFEVFSRPAPRHSNELTSVLKQMRETLEGSPRAVSLGFPGPIGENMAVWKAPTLWPTEDLQNLDLRAQIRSVFPHSAVFVINDVSAYGSFLCARGYRDFCVINIGSGVGSKIYVAGKEVNGPNARGGEIGHWRDPDAVAPLPCDCGGVGHVGALSSGRGLQRLAVWTAKHAPSDFAQSALHCENPDGITCEQVAVAVRSGDPFATIVLENSMQSLGRAAALIHVAIGCEKFFLVGGVAEALKDHLPAMIGKAAKPNCWDTGLCWATAIEVLENEVRTSLIGLHHHAQRASEGPS